MKKVWNEIKPLLVLLIKPSLARALSLPTLFTGLYILSPPFWLDLLNFILTKQNEFPQFKEPLSEGDTLTGWGLIGLAVLIYLVDVWIQARSKRSGNDEEFLDVVKDYPEQMAEQVLSEIKATGFTAQPLQDERIEKLTNEITLLRYFSSFPKDEKATNLAESIVHGELSGGTSKSKAKALALLARYLCIGETVEQAKSLLAFSKELVTTEESEIAQAFIDAVEAKSVEPAVRLLKAESSLSYSAFFAIKVAVEGSSSAIKWYEDAHLDVEQLNEDGKVALISALLGDKQWEKALNVVDTIENTLISSSPALAKFSALVKLVNAIQVVEYREVVLEFIPISAGKFPLADDSKSICLRKQAIELFDICSELAQQFEAEEIVNVSKNYSLWLQLRDDEAHQQAMFTLKSYFEDYTQQSLEFLVLANAFGIEIDLDAVEAEVNRQSVLFQKSPFTIGLARFVLALKQKSYSAAVEYIARHREQMERSLSFGLVRILEIEALAKAGLIDDAERLLRETEGSYISDSDVARIEKIFEEVKGKDPIALAISQYQLSGATHDLAFLINLLSRESITDSYYSYCVELYDRTGQELDAVRVCNGAVHLGRYNDLHQFLLSKPELVAKSANLTLHFGWSLFRKGDLNRAYEQVIILKRFKAQDVDIKALEINLAIYRGDWASLSTFVEDGWMSRDKLEADELLQIAQLAKVVSPTRTKQILEFCTSKHSDNPEIFTSSYLTATEMGWEKNNEVSEWLRKAIAISNDNGPIRRTSLEDLRDIISEAQERNSKVYKLYIRGEAPIFLVAEMLNRTMSDFYLIQPLENKEARDVRRKTLSPIFHYSNQPRTICSSTITLDVSSVLVLENIGMLAPFLESTERVVIPHYFMRWLFSEMQKVAYHQPSQIEEAKQFEKAILDRKIKVLPSKVINNPEVALEVGDELALMLEDVTTFSENGLQSLVVCPFPVTKLDGSFRNIEVDLSDFHGKLISCMQLIRKLQSLSAITGAQCSNALKYLSQYENDWPGSPRIEQGARLLLDSLSVKYLMVVDMLDVLNDVGFEVYVSQKESDRCRALMNYDSTIRKADAKLESIRGALFKEIESGKVILAEMPSYNEVTGDNNDSAGPLDELFSSFKLCDSAVLDDRFMNKNLSITIDGKVTSIYTSQDVIETLYNKGLVSQEQKFDSRSLLRELGFEFVGVSEEELMYHMKCSSVVTGNFNPTKQLRLIQENLLLIRISDLIQLPRDAQWLNNTLGVIAKALFAQWLDDGAVFEEKCARSNWLYSLMGYRQWAQTHQLRDPKGIAYSGKVVTIYSMLLAPDYLSENQREYYYKWLEKYVLVPLKESDPLSFRSLVETTGDQVKSITEYVLSQEGLDGR